MTPSSQFTLPLPFLFLLTETLIDGLPYALVAGAGHRGIKDGITGYEHAGALAATLETRHPVLSSIPVY